MLVENETDQQQADTIRRWRYLKAMEDKAHGKKVRHCSKCGVLLTAFNASRGSNGYTCKTCRNIQARKYRKPVNPPDELKDDARPYFIPLREGWENDKRGDFAALAKHAEAFAQDLKDIGFFKVKPQKKLEHKDHFNNSECKACLAKMQHVEVEEEKPGKKFSLNSIGSKRLDGVLDDYLSEV